MQRSKIAEFLAAWNRAGAEHGEEDVRRIFEHLFPGEPFREYLLEAIRIGSVSSDGNGRYRLIRREAIIRDAAFTMDRYLRTVAHLRQTMQSNIARRQHFERTALVYGLDPHDLPEFRRLAEDLLAPVLIEIDDWLTEHAIEGGVPAGVSMFQFDGAVEIDG